MYAIRVDRLLENARSDQMVAAVMKASGRFKSADGGDIKVPSPQERRAEFDARLLVDLDTERLRAAALREVARA